MDRSSKQRINKEAQRLNETLDKNGPSLYLQDCPSIVEEYALFSSAHGTLSRLDHILSHKSSLSKFKKIEIVSSIFSDHSDVRLDINYRKKNCKKHKLIDIKQCITK